MFTFLEDVSDSSDPRVRSGEGEERHSTPLYPEAAGGGLDFDFNNKLKNSFILSYYEHFSFNRAGHYIGRQDNILNPLKIAEKASSGPAAGASLPSLLLLLSLSSASR